MSKKRLLIACGLLAAAGATFVVVRILQPVRFTEEMANSIQPGMSEADVVSILGRQAGDYSTTSDGYLLVPNDYRSNVWFTPEKMLCLDGNGKFEKAWISDEGGVEVMFNAHGRVLWAAWEGYWRPEAPPIPVRIQRWVQRVLR
jgi:hypothetical protein